MSPVVSVLNQSVGHLETLNAGRLFHLNLKSGTWVLLCPLAEPFDRCEDFVGGFDPSVGFGVLVVRLDVDDDVGLQLGGGSVDYRAH